MRGESTNFSKFSKFPQTPPLACSFNVAQCPALPDTLCAHPLFKTFRRPCIPHTNRSSAFVAMVPMSESQLLNRLKIRVTRLLPRVLVHTDGAQFDSWIGSQTYLQTEPDLNFGESDNLVTWQLRASPGPRTGSLHASCTANSLQSGSFVNTYDDRD